MTREMAILSMLIYSTLAATIKTRDEDPIASIMAAANIPKYETPTTLARDITDWLAVGDSFAAGVSADRPSDQLEYWCSRYAQSYPNQMNNDPRFPGHATSRTFAFGACTGAKMDDVSNLQLELGTPSAITHPKIGKPQIGTLSISGNDLGFSDIVNSCIYHWVAYSDCNEMLKNAHDKLNDPGRAFEYKVAGAISKVMQRGRTANPQFQLYVTGYVPFFNDQNPQCNEVSWSSEWHKPKAYLDTTLRSDMNSLVNSLNALLKNLLAAMAEIDHGVFYVDGWQDKYNGHRFCEVEQHVSYHDSPTANRTWFIHYDSPFKNAASATGIGNGTFFDQVDSILIPPKNGKSTADQIQAVNGNLSQLNQAYDNVDSMTAALQQLAKDDPKYNMLPITWIRIMHPEGFGYKVMSDAVIDAVLQFGATGAGVSSSSDLNCTGSGGGNNKFLGRDDLKNQIQSFCSQASVQGEQDKDSGSITRTLNQGQRYEVRLAMDWPSGQDIKDNMNQNCVEAMTNIMDNCDGSNNPMNWKHGGTLQVGNILYHIIPTVDQGYTPGICSFHLQEDESWKGDNTPGFQREWKFHLEKLTLKDSAEKIIGTSPSSKAIEAGASDALHWNTTLADSLVMTPEAQGGDYIQFTIGSQSWPSLQTDKTKMPYCNVGGFNSQYSPDNRNMDCFFIC